MTGLVKHAAVAAMFVLAVWAIGRAWDYELATAAPPDTGGISTSVGFVGTGRVVVRGSQSERGGAGADLREAAPLATPFESTSAGGIGTAATYRNGLTKEFGNGLIRVNGHGPEWHRAKRVKAERRGDDLQRRLTRRVLQVRSLRRVVGQSFIPSYWVAIASCESGVSWTYNGSSGYDGALQYAPSTWSANRLNGYPAYAYQATPFQQLVVGEIVLSRAGWGQWPACSRKLGLR